MYFYLLASIAAVVAFTAGYLFGANKRKNIPRNVVLTTPRSAASAQRRLGNDAMTEEDFMPEGDKTLRQ